MGRRRIPVSFVSWLLILAVIFVAAPTAFSAALAVSRRAPTPTNHSYDGALDNLLTRADMEVVQTPANHRMEATASAGTHTAPAPGALVAATETGSAAINTGDVAVYTSTNAAGDVNYVGITNDVERRAAEQFASKGIRIDPIDGLENLSRADARAVEQVLIEQNGGPGGGQLLNRINSIATSNPIYAQSIQRGCTILATVGVAAPNVCP